MAPYFSATELGSCAIYFHHSVSKKNWFFYQAQKMLKLQYWSGKAIRSPSCKTLCGASCHMIFTPKSPRKTTPFKVKDIANSLLLRCFTVAVWHIASMSIQIPVHPMSIFIGTSHTVVSARIEDFRPIASPQQQPQPQPQQQQQPKKKNNNNNNHNHNQSMVVSGSPKRW